MRTIFAAMLFYSLLTCFSCASAKKAPQPLPMDIRPEDYKITFKINPNVKPVEYKRESFVRYENVLAYENDERFRYRLGIDISRHEGKINWKKVRQSGREFVFLRIGWTGYQTGIIHTDERFHYNIKKATKAGMEIGVYYFSQALNEEEAIAEAQHVIENLKGYKIHLPVVYDPESIPWEKARTDHITKTQVTKNTIAFCNEIKAAGYEPMIYSNLKWEVDYFDLEQLSEYRIWYADYRPVPKTPYHFDFLQYDGWGVKVPGIRRKCDGNIQLIRVEEES